MGTNTNINTDITDKLNDKIYIKKALKTFSSGTFLSRISGLIRDITLPLFFKVWEIDVWVVAFRIPNMLRRVLGENAVTMSVVPVITESIDKEKQIKTQRVVNSIFTVFFLILTTLIIFGIIFSPQIVKLIVPDFQKTPEKLLLTIKLTQIIFPYIFLIGITALFMGILNSVGHFFSTSVHPVFLNLSIIIFAYFSSYFEPRVYSIAIAVIAGGSIQALFQLPFLKKYNYLPKFTLQFETFELIKMGKLLLPSLLSAGVIPVTVLINTYFAAKTGNGGVSYLYYSDRLVQLPLGIFAVALGTAILPVLSKSSSGNERHAKNFSYAFKLCTLITLPATAALLALSTPIIKVLFQHGNFAWRDTVITSSALFFLTLSLYPAAIIRIAVPLFYSVKDSLSPALFSLVSLIINTVCAFFLVDTLKIQGLTLAITIAVSVNAFMLLYYFSRKHYKLRYFSTAFLIKLSVITILTFLSCYLVSQTRDWSMKSFFINDVLHLIWAGSTGMVFFIVSSYLLNIRKNISEN